LSGSWQYLKEDIDSEDWQKENGKYIPKPAKWLE
jgi:hypothetical protein